MLKAKLRTLKSSLRERTSRQRNSNPNLKSRKQRFVQGFLFFCAKASSTLPQAANIPLEDDPVAIEAASPSPQSSSVKPSSSKQIAEAATRNSKSSEPPERLHSRTARKSTAGKPPKKSSPAAQAQAPQDDSDIEEVSDPDEEKKKKKGKAKATEPDENQAAAVTRKKGKRKATSDDDIQVVEQPKRQKTRRAGSELKETTRTRTTKPSSRAASKQPAAIPKPSEDKDDVDIAQKNTKKRKINIFPTGNDVIQFSFGSMSNVRFFSPGILVFFSLCSSSFADSLMMG